MCEADNHIYSLDFYPNTILIVVYSKEFKKLLGQHSLDRSVRPFAHFESQSDLLQFIQTTLAFS